jgi:thioredoxin 1
VVHLKGRLVIVIAAVLVFGGAIALKESQKRSQGAGERAGPLQVETAALPRLVDLGSDKCIPCKRMAPILAELAEEYRGDFIVEVIDVRKDPGAGSSYGIRVIPTQIFIDAAGKELFRHEGFMAKDAILAKWEELGIDLDAKAPGTER